MYPEKMKNRYVGDDISHRIHGTYIRYKDEPYYATSEGGGQIALYTLPLNQSGRRGGDRPAFTVPTDDPDLDISSIELGYYNKVWNGGHNPPQDWKPRVHYTYRDPQKRTYRQGVSDSNVVVTLIDGRPANTNISYTDSGFVDMLKNIYPTFQEAQSLLDENEEVAISKATALQKNKLGIIFVYHRGEQVGYMTPDDRKLRLKKSGSSWVFRKFLSCYPWEIEE